MTTRGVSCPTPAKRAYTERAGAAQHLRSLARAHGDTQDMHVYRCVAGCGLWHVGHSQVLFARRLKRTLSRKET